MSRRAGAWGRFLLAVLAGFALSLGQAPISFPWLAFIALPLLFQLLKYCGSWKSALIVGWGAGLGYFGFTLRWIVEPFMVDVERHGWMAPFALGLMAAGLALFWGLAFAFSNRWKNPVIWAGFWTLFELARSYIFTGFPWALLAYNWVETPAIQVVSLIGVHGFGFIIVLAGGLVLSRRGLVLALLIVLALPAFGVWRLNTGIKETGLTVRLIQPNAIQTQKWDREFIPLFYQRQLELSQAPGAPDIVIWPEAAIAYLPDEQPLVRHQIADAAQAPVILGARRRDDAGVYNTLFLLGETGQIEAHYDKHHLVPFGEYMPLQDLADAWGLEGIAEILGGSIIAGSGPLVLDGAGVPPFLPLICYEAIFPQGIVGPRPDWLVQVTNDAWFGDISGPYQHLAQARVRAIEQGLPLARSANTGISAMVNPLGEITASLPLGEAGFVDAALPAPLPATPYALMGHWMVIWAILLGMVITMIRTSKLRIRRI